MSQLAIGYRTVVDSGHERRTDGVMKHLGVGDFGSLRVVDNLIDASSMRVGKGVEILFVKQNNNGYIQAFDRDVQNYLDFNIYARNITLSAQAGGRLILPANAASQFWDTTMDGNNHTIAVSAWSNYDLPGLVPISFTLPATARVRMDWFTQYTAPNTPTTTYFKAYLDGSNSLDVPHSITAAGQFGTSVGFGFFVNVGPGTHTAKLTVTPTQSGNFTVNAWYTRLSVTASYA